MENYILFICAWIFSIFAVFVPLHRFLIKPYLDTISELDSENSKLLEFLVELQKRSFDNYTKLKQIDRRGSFESDDEVGFAFKYLKSNIIDIKDFIDKYLNED